MALVKLVTEMYESKGSNNSLATRNPARTIMDELGPYSHFVEYFQELEDDPDHQENCSLDEELARNPTLKPENPELIHGKWVGEIPSIPGSKLSITQYSHIHKEGYKYVAVFLQYLPSESQDVQESLKQVRDVLTSTRYGALTRKF